MGVSGELGLFGSVIFSRSRPNLFFIVVGNFLD